MLTQYILSYLGTRHVRPIPSPPPSPGTCAVYGVSIHAWLAKCNRPLAIRKGQHQWDRCSGVVGCDRTCSRKSSYGERAASEVDSLVSDFMESIYTSFLSTCEIDLRNIQLVLTASALLDLDLNTCLIRTTSLDAASDRARVSAASHPPTTTASLSSLVHVAFPGGNQNSTWRMSR